MPGTTIASCDLSSDLRRSRGKYREFCSLDVSGPSKCAESLSNFNAVLDNSLRVRTGNFLRLNRELDRVIKGIFRPIREMRLLPGPLVRVQRERQPIDVNIIKFRHFLTSLPTENTFTSVLMPQICGRRKFLKGAGTNRACGNCSVVSLVVSAFAFAWPRHIQGNCRNRSF